ncbi:type II toxin-antitoxin system PemK/MazF family toxin [Brevundimonas sp. SL130]|uniref:type II toxin-antitoxin system PemK/MazF family toxin n=1 Tax=Brevundimonas sp. SL130 TaxID=2995143 RepID=UPI00226CD6CC|nr:type II toxin-antitoxin system PemK/MazF family toxin [Brevundimonas sp. SL130]WAC60995.1 type II toxin-antitoxin system PemK/MazF family toxin [Brevundimonas sp. SL130]
MKRGDLITVAVSGDHGKPRPAVVVQSDLVQTGTVLVCLMTSDIDKSAAYRQLIQPEAANGLHKPSLIQADKIYPVPAARCGEVIGSLSSQETAVLNLHLMFVLGLGVE